MEETELEIDVDDIGTILKSNRLKSKKSLEEISSELCIRKIYLAALEESDYETLPPIPYGVGYVRTYAKYLGLCPERAVKLYKAAAMQEEPVEVEEKNNESENIKINKWHIIAGIISLILVCGVWNMLTSKSSLRDEQASVTAETKETATEEKINETEEILSEEQEEAEDNSAKTDEEIENKEETTENNETKDKAKEINKDKVTVVFSGDCWAKLQDKKKVYLERVYHKGDVREIPYTPNLFLSVGVPANVKVYIKGVEKNIIATKKKMNIPLDSLN